jgi:hypothetical protein
MEPTSSGPSPSLQVAPTPSFIVSFLRNSSSVELSTLTSACTNLLNCEESELPQLEQTHYPIILKPFERLEMAVKVVFGRLIKKTLDGFSHQKDKSKFEDWLLEEFPALFASRRNLNIFLFAGRLHNLYLKHFGVPLQVQYHNWYKSIPKYRDNDNGLLEFWKKVCNKCNIQHPTVPTIEQITAVKSKTPVYSFILITIKMKKLQRTIPLMLMERKINREVFLSFKF